MAASALVSLSKKIIKPFSPTPSSERIYKLSFIDQFNSTQYCPLVFFYPKNKGNVVTPSIEPSDMCKVIENSLSKTLAAYYPFAGTLRDNVHVECNDIGADFYKARFDCPMSEIVKSPDRNVKEMVYPKGIPWNIVTSNRKLVTVQFNQFDCGGIALSTCVSHKIGDMCTISKFLQDWATIARDPNLKLCPQFIGSSIFPPTNEPVNEPPIQKCVTRRLVFSNHTLKSLLSEPSQVKNPTRVELLTALLYKCGMKANSSSLKPSILFQTVNLRSFIPLPDNTAGNFSSSLFVPTYNEEEMMLSRLVSQLRKEKEQLVANYKNCKGGQDLVSTTMRPFQEIRKLFKDMDFDMYRCSSLANYPLYDVDFGWGKPNKISIAEGVFRNVFLLYDNKTGDEVEASVCLDEESTMSAFLREMEQFLQFEISSEEIKMEARCLLLKMELSRSHPTAKFNLQAPALSSSFFHLCIFVLVACFTYPIVCSSNSERYQAALFVFSDSVFDPGNNNYSYHYYSVQRKDSHIYMQLEKDL
uniref:Acylsugar acyltransferase 3-like n=1 Tax=Nicotiana tabacum TaxID=4097 RepID=A0A1S4AW47_TOBAC|nr:PREDICTED: acylsugar acyltransferase 3-like [Nicotiana tabacum]UNH60663.1 acylsugar acyltransferase [Nicotiana tabacum]